MTALTLAPSRVAHEVRGYVRQGDTMLFTFLFPVIFLVLFSSIFAGEAEAAGSTVPMATYFLPGLVAAGVLLSGVQNLAIDIAMERGDGGLKRLGGTPMSPVTYFLGKFGQVLVTAVAQVVLLLLVAVLGFGVELPTDPARWLTFTWVFLLGLAACSLLGVALSAVPRTGRSASAVVIPMVTVLQFISGVYVADYQLPEGVRTVGALFPLAWMARGMRSVFLPEGFDVLERGGTWGLGQVALALVVWLVVGAILSRLTFRWIRRDA